MRYSTATFLCLAAAASAADTVNFFFPGANEAEGGPAVASILEQEPSTTVMRIACPTDVDSTECGWGPGVDYSILDSTRYEASMSEGSFSLSFGCDHNTQKQEMACEAFMGSETTEMTLTGTEIVFLTATLTDASASASSSAAASTTASASAAASPTLSSSADATAPASGAGATPTASTTGSASPAESTGGAYRFSVQGSALLALAGAAALNAW
ncbi:hypothetical protein BS50DRAFT_253214 [Corynespora cassiicola Philippines]|uniref:GPI anchored cell wall protein n=1 Tax=Corynespora cassiicola Philippines TaxID=1448308 RepID=A0A2T2P486_CORCC|nr:hypothetical protein BS50DRAFT_253214 [Corynespora cassiicola Philippines]